MTSAPYQYQPLPAPGWTRLLELHAGYGPIACTLRAKRIKNAVLGFEALSYVWGSDAHTNTVKIDCNGRALSIGSNLKSALTHIRHETQPRTLWVDAVCINQSDNDEKSDQVKRMGEIYASASKVLIWMGEDPAHEAEGCFDLILETNMFLMEQLAKYTDVAEIPFIARGDGSICDDHSKWEAVRHLMDSEWFTRVWVLQEVGLARAAVILWGQSSMNWSQLVELMLFVAYRVDVATHTGNVKSGTIYDVYEDVWISFANEDTWRAELPLTRSLNQATTGSQTLIDILNDGRTYQATDQRDRIYAFLSHPKASSHGPRKKAAAVVDYHKSVDEVYAETACHMLENEKHPWTVLSCIDHIPKSPSLSGNRPSWVPRWDEGFRVYWLGYPSMWYRAGGRDRQQNNFHATVSSDSLSLAAKAIILDTITDISRPFLSEELSLEKQQTTHILQKLWQKICLLPSSSSSTSSIIYGNTPHILEHIYSLVLSAGRDSSDGPAPDNPALQHTVYKAYKVLIGAIPPEVDLTAEADSNPPAPDAPQETQPHRLAALTYLANQRRALHNRRVFRTRAGYLGIGHRVLVKGDVVAIFRGANVPFVIREQAGEKDGKEKEKEEEEKVYMLVGEAYVQGVMKGEVFDDLDCDGNEGSGLAENTIEKSSSRLREVDIRIV